MTTPTTRYFHGEVELDRIRPMSNEEFAKHFRGVKGLPWDDYTRIVGLPVGYDHRRGVRAVRKNLRPADRVVAPSQPRKAGRPLDSERHMTLTATKPWIEAGMSRRTWYRRRWHDQGAADPIKTKRGRPLAADRDKTLVATKPWAKLGMSESTWRRRQKGPRKTADHWRRAP